MNRIRTKAGEQECEAEKQSTKAEWRLVHELRGRVGERNRERKAFTLRVTPAHSPGRFQGRGVTDMTDVI